MQDGRDRRGELSDAPGEHQIAEVDHPVQHPLAVRRDRPDQVVVRQITVHDLHRKQRRHALDPARLGTRHTQANARATRRRRCGRRGTRRPAVLGAGPIAGRDLQAWSADRPARHSPRRTRGPSSATIAGERYPLPCSVPPSRKRMSRTMCDPLGASSSARSPTRVEARSPTAESPTHCAARSWSSTVLLSKALLEIFMTATGAASAASTVPVASTRRKFASCWLPRSTARTTRPKASRPSARQLGRHDGGGQLPRVEEVEAGGAFA